MRLLFCFCFAVFATALTAQDMAFADIAKDPPALAYRTETKTEKVDVLRQRRERTLLGDLDLSGVWGGPTYNYTATGDDWSLMRGGFGGLEFSDEFFIGYGGWASRESFTVDDPVATSPKFDFRNSGVIIAYAPFADNAIHPRISGVVGPGKMEITEFSGQSLQSFDDRFLVGQAAIGVELNLFQWFRLGIEGGYRFASGVDNELVTAQDISGTFIQAEARFGFSW